MPELSNINIGALTDDQNAKLDSIVKQLNEWARTISNESNNTVSNDAAGTPRLVWGVQEDGTWAFKMSQSGNDVTTAADDKLIMSSGFNMFKIVETGTVNLTITNPATDGSVDITHNRPTPPIVMVWLDFGTELDILPNLSIGGSGSGTFLNFEKAHTYFVDETKIRIFYDAASAVATRTYTYRYYILGETSR